MIQEQSQQHIDQIVDQAQRYRERGWVPIPIALGGKKPTRDSWQESTLDTPLDDFTFGSNVAIVLGDKSGGLVDIDIDSALAAKLAPRFLPRSALIFGKQGIPPTHYLYRVSYPGRLVQFALNNQMIAEYRANGQNTTFPPSIYDDGAVREFVQDGEPSESNRDELLKYVARLAAASVIASEWQEGIRHNLTLALSGYLLRAGWLVDDVEHFIVSICEAAGDPEVSNRREDIRTTERRMRAGRTSTGLPTLGEYLGQQVAAKIAEWLCIEQSHGGFGHNGPPNEEAIRFTDIGNTDRFVERHGSDAVYCGEIGWMVWDGVRWSSNDIARVSVWAEATVRELVAEAKQFGRSHLGSRASVSNILELAKNRLSVGYEKFDRHDWLLNCANGTIDLKTGELNRHRKEDYLTKLASVEFDPKAACPRFMAFLNDIMQGDGEMIGFIQRALGYSLTGLTVEHCLFIAHGTGQNGKSTLFNLFEKILGGYAMNAPLTTFLAKSHDGGVPNDLARLNGARFVSAAEAEEGGHRFALSLVKRLTGGDPITARFLHKEYFSFVPKLKLWMPTNFKPAFDGADSAMTRRIHLIPFDYVVPAEKKDKDLPSKLEAEAAGLLAWAVQGCLDWQRLGLKPPARVVAATRAYQQEMDVVATFLAECVDADATSTTAKSAMTDAFEAWARENGIQSVNSSKLGGRLKALGVQDRKSGSKRFWKGVKLVGANDDFAEDQSVA